MSQSILTHPLYIHASILLHTSVDLPHRQLRYVILSSFLTVPIPFNLLRAVVYYLL